MPTDQPSNNENKTEYYVRYEATIYYASLSARSDNKYTVSTDIGNKTFVTESRTFSEIFGPVEKGFRATLVAEGEYSTADCSVKIYVCRGNEPFALKASASGDRIASTSYTIDF